MPGSNKEWLAWCKKCGLPIVCPAECQACIFRTKYTKEKNEMNLNSCNAPLPWTPHLKALLCGVRNPKSALGAFSGLEGVLIKKIYMYLIAAWEPSVCRTQPPHYDGDWTDDSELIKPGHWSNDITQDISLDVNEIAFASLGQVIFPKPQNRNVNMLPFIMGKKESLPKDLQPYMGLIDSCDADDENGKVCYLTVSETRVQPGKTQRREGLHTEAPGSFPRNASHVGYWRFTWGEGVGYSPSELSGGIYMASNIANTTEVFNALIDHSHNTVSHLGEMEHLRPFIGKAHKLKANELIWMTDRTPHEAIPQSHKGYRQYFRLVTSKVTLWFEDHSTPNPKVPIPDGVRIIKGNKFSEETFLKNFQDLSA